jgi:hypothetical protein
MTEKEYFASEFTDSFLHAQAEAGDFYSEENGYNCMPTQEEIQRSVAEGDELLRTAFLRCFGKSSV